MALVNPLHRRVLLFQKSPLYLMFRVYQKFPMFLVHLVLPVSPLRHHGPLFQNYLQRLMFLNYPQCQTILDFLVDQVIPLVQLDLMCPMNQRSCHQRPMYH